jgi:hypothetical protein
MPNLERKPIRLGPGELEDDQTPSPVLYDIEDPWGRFDFDPKSRAWNDQLNRFLSRSTANRMIVATTRRDVAEQAKGVDTVTPWLVPLEPEHYGASERQKIFELRVPGLPWDLQDPIGRSRRADAFDSGDAPQRGEPLWSQGAKSLPCPLKLIKAGDEIQDFGGDLESFRANRHTQ